MRPVGSEADNIINMNEQNKPADNSAQMQNNSVPSTKAAQHTTPLSPWRGDGGEASCGVDLSNSPLLIYNTLTRKKERFEPLHAPNVGMYVCGPTVYGDPHLGHARPSITFDVVFRYLQHLGYKVRYVRNITDVGHLEHDADDGDDKIAKKARLEQLEPMEIAQHYTNTYHAAMQLLNVLPPSIEPQASGHIFERDE